MHYGTYCRVHITNQYDEKKTGIKNNLRSRNMVVALKNPAGVIAVICGFALIFLSYYIKFDSNPISYPIIMIFTVSLYFLMWRYPRLRYW
jgi:hypothetical protein